MVYKYKTSVHILNFLIFLLILAIYGLAELLAGHIATNYILLVFAAGAAFNFVNSIFTKYTLNDKSIILTSLTKKIVIEYNQINSVYELKPSKLIKKSVVVHGNNKTITITSLTKDFIELLDHVIKKVINNTKIIIDPGLINNRL